MSANYMHKRLKISTHTHTYTRTHTELGMHLKIIIIGVESSMKFSHLHTGFSHLVPRYGLSLLCVSFCLVCKTTNSFTGTTGQATISTGLSFCIVRRVSVRALVLETHVHGKSWSTIIGDLRKVSTWPLRSTYPIAVLSFLNQMIGTLRDGWPESDVIGLSSRKLMPSAVGTRSD